MKNGYADAFPFPGSEARHQLPLANIPARLMPVPAMITTRVIN